MKIKSYFSRTVEDAMASARQELGADAMLVETRRAPAEARHLGEYEVVFATRNAAERAGAAVALSGSACGEPPGDRIAVEVAELKKQLEGMRRALTKSAFAPSQWLGSSPELAEAYAVLTANDVKPELARELVQAAFSRLGQGAPAAHRSDPGWWQNVVAQELESRITVDSSLGVGETRPRIVALVGPPGAGKTTTLVKLAVNYGLAARRPILLLTADTYRIAAADQLRSYAAILGVGFHVLETASAVAQTIAENEGKELIFLDTAGLGFSQLEPSSDLVRLLATRTDIDTHLVLSSSMKPADLTRVIDCYEIFRPRHLLFTKLDETNSFGSIFNEAVRTGNPLSFFATGQAIPEDLETASPGRLIDIILGSRRGQAVHAA
jgi:flagellar biosynthesis protein FlhF